MPTWVHGVAYPEPRSSHATLELMPRRRQIEDPGSYPAYLPAYPTRATDFSRRPHPFSSALSFSTSMGSSSSLSEEL